jgi:hypothetical protein
MLWRPNVAPLSSWLAYEARTGAWVYGLMQKGRIDPRQREMNYCKKDGEGPQGIVGILVANYKIFLWEDTCRGSPLL